MEDFAKLKSSKLPYPTTCHRVAFINHFSDDKSQSSARMVVKKIETAVELIKKSKMTRRALFFCLVTEVPHEISFVVSKCSIFLCDGVNLSSGRNIHAALWEKKIKCTVLFPTLNFARLNKELGKKLKPISYIQSVNIACFAYSYRIAMLLGKINEEVLENLILNYKTFNQKYHDTYTMKKSGQQYDGFDEKIIMKNTNQLKSIDHEMHFYTYRNPDETLTQQPSFPSLQIFDWKQLSIDHPNLFAKFMRLSQTSTGTTAFMQLWGIDEQMILSQQPSKKSQNTLQLFQQERKATHTKNKELGLVMPLTPQTLQNTCSRMLELHEGTRPEAKLPRTLALLKEYERQQSSLHHTRYDQQETLNTDRSISL